MVIQSRAISRSIISEIPWNIVLNETESDGGASGVSFVGICLSIADVMWEEPTQGWQSFRIPNYHTPRLSIAAKWSTITL